MGWSKTPYGRLVIERTSQTLAEGGMMASLDRIKKNQMAEHFRKARAWVDAAILAVRQADEPNPHRNATDDAIAQTILDKIEEKRKERAKP